MSYCACPVCAERNASGIVVQLPTSSDHLYNGFDFYTEQRPTDHDENDFEPLVEWCTPNCYPDYILSRVQWFGHPAPYHTNVRDRRRDGNGSTPFPDICH